MASTSTISPLIETQGIDVIAEQERRGTAKDLFWPWFSANVSVLGIAWGSYIFDFGISLAQAILVTVVGTIGSFALVGLISLAGQRGSAPTMVLSRAAFGKHGNIAPGIVSYLLLVGWETVQCATAVLATSTVANHLGVGFGGVTEVAVFIVIVIVVILLGVLGFDAVMKAQKWLGWLTIALTVGFMIVTANQIDLAVVTSRPAGSIAAVIGATVMVISGFGVGWTSAAADYSRYLPGGTSRRGIVGWTTLGGSLSVIALLGYGLLLCGSDPELAAQVTVDPVGALTAVLPTWFIIPFWLVAISGLIAGMVIDIYSSGLALVAIGLPMQRWVAAALDGVLMTIGTIYVVWFASDFLGPFQAFLITLGVPLAAWTGIFGADLIYRYKVGYDELALDDASSKGVGSVHWPALLIMLGASVLGFGLVTSSLEWLAWEGFLLGPLGFGGREGGWAYANVGVLAALLVSFVAYLPFAKRAVLAARG